MNIYSRLRIFWPLNFRIKIGFSLKNKIMHTFSLVLFSFTGLFLEIFVIFLVSEKLFF